MASLASASIALAAQGPPSEAPALGTGSTARAQRPGSPPSVASSSAGSGVVPEVARLLIPVRGVAAAELRDSFDAGRPGHRHGAIDIAAPRGTEVLAVDDGRLVKLFSSVPGGLTLYQFDLDERFVYYYAHLDRYADGVREGMRLRRGDVIGYVGSSGNASRAAPHLHFAVFRLGAERQWWKGEAVNPFNVLH